MQVKKIKPVRPSMREKKRYLVAEAVDATLERTDSDKIKKAIIQSHKRLFGIYGLARAGIMFLNSKGKRLLIRVNNKELDNLRTSMSFITHATNDRGSENRMLVKSIGVSGTLKKANEKYMQID